MTEEVRTALIEIIAKPPNSGDEAALVWASRLVDIDDAHPDDLSLGSGFFVLFYPTGSRPSTSFYEIAPSTRISVRDRTLEHLCGKSLHYVIRRVRRKTRTECVRVLTV